MKHIILLGMVIALACQTFFAQTPTLQWARMFDGYGLDNKTIDAATDVNGNVYTAGWSQKGSTSEVNYVITKYTSSGARKWTTTWDPGTTDYPTSITVKNGWVYITGRTKISTTYNIGTMKIDTGNGSTANGGWQVTFGVPTGTYNEEGVVVRVDASGNVFVAAKLYATNLADFLVVRYNPTATTTTYWQREVSGQSLPDTLRDLLLDGSGNVYVTGISQKSGNGFDYVTFKLDNAITSELWTAPARYNNSSVNGDDDPKRLILNFTGSSLWVTGISYGGTTDLNDIATVKYDASTGATASGWPVRKAFRVYNNDEVVRDITSDGSDNTYLTGGIGCENAKCDKQLWVMKYNASGAEQWYTRTYGANSSPAEARRIVVDASGNSYVGLDAYTYDAIPWSNGQDMIVQKFDANGAAGSGVRFDAAYSESGFTGAPTNPDDYVTSMTTDGANGNIYLVGASTSFLDSSKDLYAIILKVNVGINFSSRALFVHTGPENDELGPDQYQLSQNYPNPFNPATTIKFSLAQGGMISLKVYDVVGREIKTLIDGEYYDKGPHEIHFNASDLAGGVYFYRIIADGGRFHEVKKMLLVK